MAQKTTSFLLLIRQANRYKNESGTLEEFVFQISTPSTIRLSKELICHNLKWYKLKSEISVPPSLKHLTVFSGMVWKLHSSKRQEHWCSPSDNPKLHSLLSPSQSTVSRNCDLRTFISVTKHWQSLQNSFLQGKEQKFKVIFRRCAKASPLCLISPLPSCIGWPGKAVSAHLQLWSS